MARKGYSQLSSLSDLRKFVAKLINERKRGALDSSTARDCGYLCKLLVEILERGEFEERILKLETLFERERRK